MYPDNAQCFEKLGLYYEKIDDLEKAITNLRTAVDMESSSTPFLLELAEVLIKAGKLEESRNSE